MDPHTYLLSIRRKLKVSSFSNEKSVKKESVEKIEEISVFNNDRTRIVERIDKKGKRDQRFWRLWRMLSREQVDDENWYNKVGRTLNGQDDFVVESKRSEQWQERIDSERCRSTR